MIRNNRAQIGETMTWIIATIVIIIILSFSIFVAIPISSFGKFNEKRKSDLLATKSLVNYLGKEGIYNELKDGGELNKEDENRIEGLYEKDYAVADLGVVPKDPVVSGEVDEYERSVEIIIELNDKKDILLSLREEIE
jgi:hypothetical protein